MPYISLQYHRQVPVPDPIFFSDRAYDLPGPGVVPPLAGGGGE